jgi:hypothetical protein
VIVANDEGTNQRALLVAFRSALSADDCGYL